MSTVAEGTLISAEEFLRMPDQKGFELIDGVLVERSMSVLSSWVGTVLARLIGNYVAANGLGWVFGADNGFQCFASRPKLVRKPDVSFVKSDRMTWKQVTDGWLGVIPDLVVEVISPNDTAYEVEEKIELFLKAGVPLLWVVNPDVRTVRIIRGDGSMALLRELDELLGEDVLPGFATPVASIFPPLAAKDDRPDA